MVGCDDSKETLLCHSYEPNFVLRDHSKKRHRKFEVSCDALFWIVFMHVMRGLALNFSPKTISVSSWCVCG